MTRLMFFLLLDTYTVGKRIREVAAEDLTLRAGLQEVLQAVAVDGGLQLRDELPGAGAVGLDEGSVDVLGPDVFLPLLHGAVGLELPGGGGLHDLVEPLVRHGPADQQLAGADVVQGEGLDLGDVDAHLPVDAGALDADDDSEVGGEPGDVRGPTTVTAHVVGRNISDVVHKSLLELHKALVLTSLSIVLKGTVKRNFFGIEKNTHPLLFIRFSFSLEMISPVIRHHVESETAL